MATATRRAGGKSSAKRGGGAKARRGGGGKTAGRSGGGRSQSARGGNRANAGRAAAKSRSAAGRSDRSRKTARGAARASGRSATARASKSAGGGRTRSGSSGGGGAGGRSSQATVDHEQIRRWAEARSGQPSCVRGTGGGDDVGMLRIDFPGYSGADSLQPISWDEFFEKFDERGLALVYQDTTRGQKSNFNKLVSRDDPKVRKQMAGR